jgi:hypothetical protein
MNGKHGLPLFKPQWAYPTPEGFRDEMFTVPFAFELDGDGRLVRSLPWSFDDDVPYLIRGIVFPQIGTHEPINGVTQNPAFCRIWEPHGNPLSSRGLVNADGPEYLDLALALGVWGQSGYEEGGQGINGWGFPIEPEIECPPGATVLFDFQMKTTAGIGILDVSGVDDIMEFVAGVIGVAGASFTIALLDPGAPNVPLSVALVGGVNVQVTLATDGGSALISTFAQVVAAVNAAALAGSIPAPAPNSAFPIMYAYLIAGDGTDIAAAFVATPLVTGATASTDVYMTGVLLGVKRFQDCL